MEQKNLLLTFLDSHRVLRTKYLETLLRKKRLIKRAVHSCHTGKWGMFFFFFFFFWGGGITIPCKAYGGLHSRKSIDSFSFLNLRCNPYRPKENYSEDFGHILGFDVTHVWSIWLVVVFVCDFSKVNCFILKNKNWLLQYGSQRLTNCFFVKFWTFLVNSWRG